MSKVTIPDGLPGWIQDHLRRYLESDGEDGHMWDTSAAGGTGRVQTLLLTTTGRRSGDSRILPLIYGEAEGSHVIVASRGGHPHHPSWYLNLVAEPGVGVQVGARRFRARARTAQGDERSALWKQMLVVWPAYAEYQQRTKREIPVVVLEPLES